MNKPGRNPNKGPDPNLIKLSAPTVMALMTAAVLVPLLLTGFISQ